MGEVKNGKLQFRRYETTKDGYLKIGNSYIKKSTLRTYFFWSFGLFLPSPW